MLPKLCSDGKEAAAREHQLSDFINTLLQIVMVLLRLLGELVGHTLESHRRQSWQQQQHVETLVEEHRLRIDQLKQIAAAKDSFVAKLSHDLADVNLLVYGNGIAATTWWSANGKTWTKYSTVTPTASGVAFPKQAGAYYVAMCAGNGMLKEDKHAYRVARQPMRLPQNKKIVHTYVLFLL